MDRTLFIQWEIGCLYIDNFESLPLLPACGSVYRVDNAPYERMSAFFYMTH